MDPITIIGGTSQTAILKHESHKLHHSFPVTGKKTVITFDAALVASNVVNGKIDGESIAAVTYATSSDATMAAVAAAIAAMPGVKSAAVVPAGAGLVRVIEVISTTRNAYNSATSFAVTGGASQAGIVITTVDSAIKQGMPVELNATTGKLQPVTTATASTTLLGIALHPSEADEVCTVMCMGMAVVEGQASGAVTPGPVKYDGYDTATNRVKYSSDTVTATNMVGWATAAADDTDIVEVIVK